MSASTTGQEEIRDLVELRAAIARVREGLGESAAARLDGSVLRPLDALLGASTDGADGDSGATGLRELALAATRLRAADGAGDELIEATAGLQALACESAADTGDADLDELIGELRELQSGLEPELRVAADGPYLVTNAEDLRDWLGCSLAARPQMALCRCGASRSKPFCDGTHASNGFSGNKSPDRIGDRHDTYEGLDVTVYDNRGVCQHSGFCTDRVATAFRAHEDPFVAASGGRLDEIVRAVRDCPSGALSFGLDGVEARSQVDRQGTRDAAVEVTRDGPYRVTGALPLREAGGEEDVVRNAGASLEHYALCRCGQSQNKPFCSGMHWYVDFHDPLPDPETTPTMFEWAGGLPALTRMTRLFYEKHVPEDELLAPIFAGMSPDHPERVAKWLGEVFGGPPAYSDEYGGYSRMLSQHLGKCLTEEQRTHWVELLLRSAAEAELPNDAEFRSAFGAYVEWGSRLAIENSQTGAEPPPKMPMPRWDWNTGAGPPGGRIAALEPAAEEPAPEVEIPAAGEPVGFAAHIKPLFRERDRRSMQFAFDLWALDDARTNADAILERLKAGTMPCDGSWSPDWVELLERWIAAGMEA